MSSPKPLIAHIYTADPSAHVFSDGKLYIYPSHDEPTDISFNDNGDQYAMSDYHVFSMTDPSAKPIDHGVALSLEDVPWASKQLWAPDATEKNGKFYLYFPARDHEGIFRIGVAISEQPGGPFVAEKTWIEGSYSIDPAVFTDSDGSSYLYFGGIWGGQLQCWSSGSFNNEMYGSMEPEGAVPALGPRVAKLRDDMLGFTEEGVKEIEILGEDGEKIGADDHKRRFFEAAWMHKRNGLYYLSYSTGDEHEIVYATGKSAWGPFQYRGRILEEVLGWTNHHSVVEWKGRWWVFYHDASLSGGVDHLRCVKMREIEYGGVNDEEIFLVGAK